MSMSRYMCGMEKGQVSMSVKKPMPRLSETAAFAFSAAEDYGGCVWPPRTYTCSFCGREFRSAQALGGHMNVHRRDRARLKHYQESDLHVLHHDHILEANPRFGVVLGSKNIREGSRKPDATKRENNVDDVAEDSLKNLGDGEVRTDLSVGLMNSELCQKPAMRSSCKRAKRVHHHGHNHHHHQHHHDVSSRLPLMLELVLGVLEPTRKTISKNNIINNNNHDDDEELDLELRLGAHDPQEVN